MSERLFEGLPSTNLELLLDALDRPARLKWVKDGVGHLARYGDREYNIYRTKQRKYRMVVRMQGEKSKVIGRPLNSLEETKLKCELYNTLLMHPRA